MTPGSIQRIRRSLAFTEREEALLREASPRLVAEVPPWVDRFYARLVVDPEAMALLQEEASVIRLKRSLNAWFLELFSLPYDAAYERARTGIGRTHVRIAMPQHLMVTAMGGVRRDVRESIERIWADDPPAGRRVLDALDKAFDMELALMLEQFRQRSRELAHEADRGAFAERAAHRLAAASRIRVDAALCYAELARRARDDAERDRWFVRLAAALEGVTRLGRGVDAVGPGAGRPLEAIAVADLCARALNDVSLPIHTNVAVSVEPRALAVRLFRLPFELAVEEMLQDAVNRDPGGTVRLEARHLGTHLVLDVIGRGPGGGAAHRDADESPEADLAAGLAHAEHAAHVHGGSVERTPVAGGGTCVRLRVSAARVDVVQGGGPGVGPGGAHAGATG